MRGVRVYSWSPMESKAFGSFSYEVTKKVKGLSNNFIFMLPSFGTSVVVLIGTIKWAEWKYESEIYKHRD